MPTKMHRSKRVNSGLCRPILLLAAAAYLWPAVAIAGGPENPTPSDTHANTAAGQFALWNVTGFDNTAIGRKALFNTTTGDSNTASGAYALTKNTTGSHNTASGTQALGLNTIGNWNTADGFRALYGNRGGGYNTASGYRALFGNSDGGYNTAGGKEALFSNTIGGYGTALGAEALYSNVDGLYNTAVGYRALSRITNGSSNVAVGPRALSRLTKESGGNVALGPKAGFLTKGGYNNIYIGSFGVSGRESDVTRIGQGQKRVFVTGIAGVPLSGASVVVKSNGQLGVVASSARYKQDITPVATASETLAKLRPVSFSYKAEPDAMHYGLIAEEVDEVMPELVVRDEQNRPESVQYLELIPLLIAERQELKTELQRQRLLIEEQAEALAELRRMLDTRLAAFDPTTRPSSDGR